MPNTSFESPYVIAEIGANHNGDMALARKLIDAAKTAGADAAKFQSWGKGLFARCVYDSAEGLEAQVEKYAVARDEMEALAAYCRDAGIDFISTPCSVEEVEHLNGLNPPSIKIASMDLNNPEMLIAAAETGRRVIFSTGFGSMGEIEQAVRYIEDAGNRDIVILHCVALYPPPSDRIINLRNMDTIARAFGYPVGYSDHTIGIEIPLAAIALGAAVIEKHFTLDKTMEGWDHAVSADPDEMAAIARAGERIPAALGSARRDVSREERKLSQAMRRSAVAARPIESGQVITEKDIVFRRPGTGIPPDQAHLLHGQLAARDMAGDTIFDFADFRQSA